MTQSEPTLIGGRYELGELLGRGGMAEVRKGKDRRLGHPWLPFPLLLPLGGLP